MSAALFYDELFKKKNLQLLLQDFKWEWIKLSHYDYLLITWIVYVLYDWHIIVDFYFSLVTGNFVQDFDPGFSIIKDVHVKRL